MYTTIEVNFNKLVLDNKNPRFVTNENKMLSNNEIMEYLIKFEDVISLAESINDYGGLIPGERLLVYKEKDNYVVLEGNRRTAAIKLLLNPDQAIDTLTLSKSEIKRISAFKENVTDGLKGRLSRFQVDTVSNREEGIYSLTERHIDGIKKWSQISKMYFYKQHFDSGKNLRELEEFTGENSRSIADTLRKYNYLRYVLSSYRIKYPEGRFNNAEIETQIPTELIVQRIFNSLKDKLKFKFDDSYNFSTSHYACNEKNMLKEILADIAYLYWDLEKINTRNLNKVEDFDNVFFDEKHHESSEESITIGKLITKLESSLIQSNNNKIDIKNNDQDNNDQENNDQENNDQENNDQDNNDQDNNDQDNNDQDNNDLKPNKDCEDNNDTATENLQDEYQLYLKVKKTKTRVKIYNDFDLMELVLIATDTNNADLKSKITFNTEHAHLIDNTIFSGEAREGIYNIQAKLSHNGKTVSKGLVIEVYVPKIKFKTNQYNNLFTSVTAFSLDSEIEIDINNTINGLIEEMQSLKDPEKYKLMISSSVRQLIELSVRKIIADKNLKDHGNPKENLKYLIENKFTDNNLFREICNGDNKIKYNATKNLVSSIDTNQLWNYLNLLAHDSYASIYSELVEKINKQITPLLVVFHNYLKLSKPN